MSVTSVSVCRKCFIKITYFRNSTGSSSSSSSGLGLFTGVSVSRKTPGKILVSDNLLLRCDVGVHAVGADCSPAVTANHVEGSFFAGLFAEAGARPNAVGNRLVGKNGGLGCVLIAGSSGLLGKNRFERYRLSPVMSFASCRPLVKANAFADVAVDRPAQEAMEARMREASRAEAFAGDDHFFIVDSEEGEEGLRETLLKSKEERDQ